MCTSDDEQGINKLWPNGITVAIDFSSEFICFENWWAKPVGYGSDDDSVN